MSQIDLSPLAVRRDAPNTSRLGRVRWWSRYFFPALMLAGLLALLIWAGRDLIFPPLEVTTSLVTASRAEITSGSGEIFRSAGWIEPRPTPIRVPALAPGIIRKLSVVEDQAVTAGEPIAELVDEDAQLMVRQAAADLKLRQAELEIAQAACAAALTRFEQPVHLQAALSEAEASLAEIDTAIQALPFETRQAQAQLDFARLDFQRKSAADESVSRRAIDEAKSALDSAAAMYEQWVRKGDSLKSQQIALTNRRDAIHRQLELLADEIRARDETIAGVKVAQARVEQATVALANAQLSLDRTIIRAPMDGRVFRVIGFPGASVGPADAMSEDFDPSTVVTLYQPESLQVRADVRFENLPLVRLGQKVSIMNPALHEPIGGTVLFAGSKADIQKNTLQVKVAIDSPATVLKPEMLVEVVFFGNGEASDSEPTSALRLFAPRSSVLNDESGDFVWIADQSTGRAVKTPVTTGIQLGDLVELTKGVNPGSRLIDSDFARLRNGQRIRVIEHSDNAASHAPSPPER